MEATKGVAAVGAGVSTVALGVLAWARIRKMQERLEGNRVRISETLPIHSKWWRDVAKEEGDLLYVAIGDSAAQGVGASAPKNSYVGVIADHIAATTGRSVRTVNLSVSGATVALAVADQLPRFAELEPDVVTVAIGANDIAHFDAAKFEEGIRKVFAELPDDAIVADLPYFYLPWTERRKVSVGNRILQAAAEERGLTVIPLHEAMRRQGLRGAFTQFAEDLFHPNDHGYRVWASAFLPAVTALVSERFPRRPAAERPVAERPAAERSAATA